MEVSPLANIDLPLESQVPFPTITLSFDLVINQRYEQIVLDQTNPNSGVLSSDADNT